MSTDKSYEFDSVIFNNCVETLADEYDKETLLNIKMSIGKFGCLESVTESGELIFPCE